MLKEISFYTSEDVSTYSGFTIGENRWEFEGTQSPSKIRQKCIKIDKNVKMLITKKISPTKNFNQITQMDFITYTI